MRKLLLLALPCAALLLSACGSSGGGGGYSQSYESSSSGGYATFSPSDSGTYYGGKYSESVPYSTSAREYPVNRTATVRTG